MQTQSVQTWRGCSQTIPLAGMTPLEERASVPVLSEESPLKVGLPPSEQTIQWKPGTAEEISIGRIQEPSLPSLSLADVHRRDYSVEGAASYIGMSPDLLPDKESALQLWKALAQASEVEPEALRVSPEAPTEIKYRIWVQPMEEAPLHQLGLAAERPCPPMVMPGMEALKAAIEHSDTAGQAGLPGLEGLALQGLARRAGTPLQSVMTLTLTEPEHLLYPGSPRIPIPANSTIG